ADYDPLGSLLRPINLSWETGASSRACAIVLNSAVPPRERRRKRMSWTIPWFSSAGSDFNVDFGVTRGRSEMFGLSVFFRADDQVLRPYSTRGRGVGAPGSRWPFLDLPPRGGGEDGEAPPEGGPKPPPYLRWRRHDEYGT